MKAIIFYCLLALCGFSFAYVTPKDYIPKIYVIDDHEILRRELLILKLFKNINDPIRDKELLQINFKPYDHLDLFSQPQWIQHFLDIKTTGGIFSVYHQRQLDMAIALFKVFYYAKDFDTFVKTAVWARSLTSKDLFLYALTVALVHRPDSFGLILPPIHEIYPYYFFSSEKIQKAHEYKKQHLSHVHETNRSTIYEIVDNRLDRFTNLNEEQLLTYFTEDVGLNSFYYYYHIYYPWWMDGEEFGLAADHRGEIFYYIMSQLLARYNAERLSNGLEEVIAIDFDAPVDTGYYPSLTYPNGVQFPSRPDGVNLRDAKGYLRDSNFTNSYRRLRDFAFRIQNVVDLGRAYSGVEIYQEGVDGLEILSNLLEGNPNSPNLPYYGTLQIYARHLLGYVPEPWNPNYAIPAATEHYETTLRDPASWRFFKWLLSFYEDFYKHKSPYTYDNLNYPGVSIDSVHVEEFKTFFEPFSSDISQVVFHSEDDNENEDFEVRVIQARLTHVPLLYNITVTSNLTQTGLVKVFLGPRNDRYGQRIEIMENGDKFYLVDYFSWKLKEGANVIIRSASQGIFPPDKTGYKKLFDNVENAIRGEREFVIHGGDAYWTFPSRLLLPKGTTGGMPFQLYFIVIPSQNPGSNLDDKTYKPVGTGRRTGIFTLRYPLDRKIVDKESFDVPNSFHTDVIIRHYES